MKARGQPYYIIFHSNIYSYDLFHGKLYMKYKIVLRCLQMMIHNPNFYSACFRNEVKWADDFNPSGVVNYIFQKGNYN